MLTSYFAAVGALGLLTVMPGPDLAMVTRYTLNGGRAAGLRVGLGIVAGLTAWGAMTALGLAALLAASSTAYVIVKVAGAVFLVVLGVRALWQTRRSGVAQQVASPQTNKSNNAFRGGLLTNLFNPKIAVFYTSLLPSLVPRAGSPGVWLPVLVATHLVLSIAWFSTCAVVFSRSRSLMQNAKVRVWLDRVTGSVLVALGIRIATKA